MTNIPTGVVTFFVTDIEGSTQRFERSWDDMSSALARHDAVLRACIQAEGGYVVKTVGDAFFAAFTSTWAALAAAIGAQRRLRDDQIDLRVRVALHTGQAEERDGDYYGPPVNRAHRLLSAGHGRQILISRSTREQLLDRMPADAHLIDLGEHHLKDLSRTEQVYQVVVPDLPAEFPPLRTLGTQPNNLPLQRTPFIGRAAELEQLEALLRDHEVRIVTLVGAGGTGKSRLGLQIAATMLDAYADGVYFVPLATVSQPDGVEAAVAHALRIQERANQTLADALADHLGPRALLLVLDNFEHVLGARMAVARLLDLCPELNVLVTSRSPLRLSGEREFPVACLALPDREPPPPPATMSQYEAVALFIERARMVKPDFAVTNENAPAIAEICYRLDGLPLAIELAAARSRALVPQAILDRLSLKLLTRGTMDELPHHAALRDAIAWSFELLGADERLLLCRTAVFVGTFSLDAAEAICDPNHDLSLEVIDGLDGLVEKSLLRAAGRESARFSLLQTIREFALGMLEEGGEAAELQRRHATYYRDLVVAADLELRGPDQAAWFHRLEQEHANIRTALEYAAASADAELGTGIAGAVSRFWDVRGHLSDGRAWLTRMLELGPAPPPIRALALLGAADLAWRQGDFAAALGYLEESLAHYRAVGDTAGEAAALSVSGNVLFTQGRLDDAETALQRSLELRRELGDIRGVGSAMGKLAAIASIQGDFAAALPLSQEALRLRREAQDAYGIAAASRNLGKILFGLGNLAAAEHALEESLTWCRQVGDRRGLASGSVQLALIHLQRGDAVAAGRLLSENLKVFAELGSRVGLSEALEGLGWVAVANHDLQRAARLCGAADELREGIQAQRPYQQAKLHEWYRDAGSSEMSADMWADLEREGRAMTQADVVAYALGAAAPRPPALQTVSAASAGPTAGSS